MRDEVAAGAPVEIRLAHRHDAQGLARLFERCYGRSYDHAWAYDPDAIHRRWTTGVMTSAVGVTPDGELVGHLALTFDRPGQRVGESANAVVDPRYRGHHLFESLKTFLAEWAGAHGLYGLYSEATAAHPYSQRGNLALGAYEMGFLIGYIPGGVRYREIGANPAKHRQTAALMYLRTNPEPSRIVHPPPAVAGIVWRVYANGGFDRRPGRGAGAGRTPGTRFTVRRDHDHNVAVLAATAVGSDLHEIAERESVALAADGVECVYLDLPLAAPGCAAFGDRLHELGYFFACIIPEIAEDGDVLRLQRLNGVDPHLEEAITASAFGRQLLEDIRRDLGSGTGGSGAPE